MMEQINCIVIFQPVCKYFKTVNNTNKVTACKSKGWSNESIKPPSTSNNSLNSEINYIDNVKYW